MDGAAERPAFSRVYRRCTAAIKALAARGARDASISHDHSTLTTIHSMREWTLEERMNRERETQETASPLLEAAAVLLENAGGTLLTTLLNKALFYLDVRSLLETGKTVTGESYVALKAGPVVESYPEKLIGGLERHNIATQDADNPDYKPVTLLRRVVPKRMSDKQLALARVVAKWAAGMSSTEISNFSHENPAWRVAYDGGAGSGNRLNLHLAIQQFVDEDPWIHQELSPDEKTAFEMADDGEAREW